MIISWHFDICLYNESDRLFLINLLFCLSCHIRSSIHILSSFYILFQFAILFIFFFFIFIFFHVVFSFHILSSLSFTYSFFHIHSSHVPSFHIHRQSTCFKMSSTFFRTLYYFVSYLFFDKFLLCYMCPSPPTRQFPAGSQRAQVQSPATRGAAALRVWCWKRAFHLFYWH